MSSNSPQQPAAGGSSSSNRRNRAMSGASVSSFNSMGSNSNHNIISPAPVRLVPGSVTASNMLSVPPSAQAPSSLPQSSFFVDVQQQSSHYLNAVKPRRTSSGSPMPPDHNIISGGGSSQQFFYPSSEMFIDSRSMMHPMFQQQQPYRQPSPTGQDYNNSDLPTSSSGSFFVPVMIPYVPANSPLLNRQQYHHNSHPPPPPSPLLVQRRSPLLPPSSPIPRTSSSMYPKPLPSTPITNNGSANTKISESPVRMPGGLTSSSVSINMQLAAHPQDQLAAPCPSPVPRRRSQVLERTDSGLYRHRTIKTVKLSGGNFSVNIPVPAKALAAPPCTSSSSILHKHRSLQSGFEFSNLRYTAVIGDPDEFVPRGYTLRQREWGRQTELFVVITMYNEDEVLFIRTWKAVAKNIAHICSKKNTWGEQGWQKVVVCVVSDGRTKINARTLSVLGLMGVYQEGLIKLAINDDPVSAHVFEYTTQLVVDLDFKIKGPDSGHVPIQTIFCLKEKNAKKINSHRWFFNAFGRILLPKVCVLIDVGTKPTEPSLYRLWKAFENNPNCAGACGEIYTETGRFGRNLLNPLVAAQNFEYKMSNILDKPLESVFGFISVLPGAFSAYRYSALQGAPLEKYFLGEKMHDGNSVTMANMYLAEDRILCFELVTKRGEAWVLKYVKNAKAETDVPNALPEFISQRRRWLNGSFFAMVHSLLFFTQILRTNHSFTRKFFLLIQVVYNSITLLFSWFSLANLYLIFYFMSSYVASNPNSPFTPPVVGGFVNLCMTEVYLLSLVVIFIASLGNRPQGSKVLYTICFVLFATIMALLLFFSFWSVYQTIVLAQSTGTISVLLKQSYFRDLIISIGSTYGMYFLASFAHREPWHMFTSFIQYLLFLPSFTNILMVYAFSNLHDVSWGTKGDTGVIKKCDDSSGAVKVQKTDDNHFTVTTDFPVNQKDIDYIYELQLREICLQTKKDRDAALPKPMVDLKQKQEDFFKSFRTSVVLSWVFSNTILIVFLTTTEVSNFLNIVVVLPDGSQENYYLVFILWSVAFLSTIKFVGSMLYLAFSS